MLNAFLPKPLTDEELTAALKEIIASVGATSPKDMGKVMGVATKQLSGKADGKAISEKGCPFSTFLLNFRHLNSLDFPVQV